MESPRVLTRLTRSSGVQLIMPPLPPRAASGRKRFKKTLGPDFIQDFTPGAARAAEALKNVAAAAAVQQQPAEWEPVVVVVAKPPPPVPPSSLSRESSLDLANAAAAKAGKQVGTVDICQICQKPDTAESHDILIHCKGRGCHFEAHVRCLMAMHLITDCGDEPAPTFRCGKCKRCCICWKKKPLEAESKSVTCTGCHRLFHMRCHFPNVSVKIPGWKCTNCLSGRPKEDKIDFSIRKSTRFSTRRKLEEEAASNAEPEIDLEKIEPINLDRYSHSESYSDRATEEKSLNGKSSTVEEPGDLESDRLLFLSEDIVTPERERSPTPDDINPQFISLLEFNQDKMCEERERRKDIATWDVEQCRAYFHDSYPELAELIVKHELYGSSLMIISRNQFSELFGLSVGKFLRFFNAVCQWRRTTF